MKLRGLLFSVVSGAALLVAPGRSARADTPRPAWPSTALARTVNADMSRVATFRGWPGHIDAGYVGVTGIDARGRTRQALGIMAPVFPSEAAR